MILINHYLTLITHRFLLGSVGIKIQLQFHSHVDAETRDEIRRKLRESICDHSCKILQRLHLHRKMLTGNRNLLYTEAKQKEPLRSAPTVRVTLCDTGGHAHTEPNPMVQVDHMKVILFTTESSCKCPIIKASVSNTMQLFAEMLLISSKSATFRQKSI